MKAWRPGRRTILLLRWLFAAIAIVAPMFILFMDPEVKRFESGPLEGADVQRTAAWIVSLLGMGGLFVQAGLEIKGRVLGVLIDERNRYSLSRLQMTLWSKLLLSSLYVIFLSNMVREPAQAPAPGAPAAQVATGALVVDLDWNLVLLMGLSVASFVTSPLVLSRKSGKVADASELRKDAGVLVAEQNLLHRPGASGVLLVKESPQDARVADLIRGEEVGNATTVDIARTQMLLITLIVVIAYAVLIAEDIAFHAGPITQLPLLGNTLLGLILVSHAGYLGGKLVPVTRGEADAAGTAHLGKALQLSQRATELVRDIQARLAEMPDDTGRKRMEDFLALARSAAAQASTLPGRAGTADFKVTELFALEARIETLASSLKAFLGGGVPTVAADAPAPAKVAEVQQKLQGRGYKEVVVSGIPDAITERAIQAALASLGIDREHLHPRPYRYYEEVAELL